MRCLDSDLDDFLVVFFLWEDSCDKYEEFDAEDIDRDGDLEREGCDEEAECCEPSDS